MNSAVIWLVVTLLCIAIQGFYSMMEMAAVSFNRARLEYYVSKNVRRAVWLQYFLSKPSRLFGTIMLGVNAALQIGSQSSREFYRAININPDFALITQVFLVVIFAELAPLFAARRFPEHVVMLGIGVIYVTYRLFAPFIWLISKMTHLLHLMIGKKGEEFDLFLTREELQKELESHEEEDEFNRIVSNIFSLRAKTPTAIMTPLSEIEMIPANSSIEQIRKKLFKSEQNFIPLYHKKTSNIVAIAVARDLVRLADNRNARDYSRTPWFITSTTKLTQILGQFRRNRQTAAVILDQNGSAIGILTLDAILEEIFGEHPDFSPVKANKSAAVIHRTFPGNMKIQDFNKEFDASLKASPDETLAQMMMSNLNHPPESGDAIVIDDFELIAEETTLLGIKSITINTIET